MTPVDTPWHFTTWLDALDHWQTVIAGVLALAAGVLTVVVTRRVANRQIAASREEADRVIAATREQTETTIRLERQRVLSELDALRKSLAVELRQQISRALGVHSSLQKLGSKPDGPITARMVESLSRMPAPIIYSANAGKIGLLGDDAMDVAMVYTLLEGARDGAARLITAYRTPDDVAPAVVLKTAEVFLEACKWARGVLPRLPTGVASHDAQDEALIRQINAAASQ